MASANALNSTLRAFVEQQAVFDVATADIEGRVNIFSYLPEISGSRQVFDLSIALGQTPCKTSVPIIDFRSTRAEVELVPFCRNMGKDGVRDYWRHKRADNPRHPDRHFR